MYSEDAEDATMANPFRRMTREARLKAIALALLAIPLAVLALFAVGEVAGGDWSGLQHVVQALPLVLLALAAYRWPVAAGWLLVVVGAGIMGLYVVLTYSRFELATIAVAEFIFAMPVVAGILLVLAGRSASPSGQ
jgi:hypothetical protein